MAREITTTIYQFDELSDKAKERARDQWRSHIGSDDYKVTIEDAVAIGNLLGIEFETQYPSTDPCIRYNIGGSQGDGACFEGRYSYKKGSVNAIAGYAPLDEALHRIAKGLQQIQAKNFFQIFAVVKHRGHYCHSRCTDIDVERLDGKEVSSGAEGAMIGLLRDFMDWIYKQLLAQDEYLSRDEQVEEAIRANEYEFYETGELV